jgi:predicted nucleic acid-binding Zn ribbon protein
MRKSTPQPINDILQDVVASLNQIKKGDFSKISSSWASCAGKDLARHTRPLHLQRKTLLVGVDESAWLYQANLQKGRLLKALQKKIGAQKVQAIQFRIGNV